MPVPTRRRAVTAALAVTGVAGLLAVRRRRAAAARVVELHDVRREDDLGPAVVVVNPGGGSADGVELGGARVRELREGEDLRDALEEVADEGAGVIGVAGGDGSVGCAAGVACDRDRILWAVPGGTLNHFARDIGMCTPEDAVAALKAGRIATIDVGEAAGVAFVNNASIGVYADLVRRRERLEHRMPKRLALLIAAGRTLRKADRLDVHIDGEPRRVFLVFAGNNAYSGAGLTTRDSLQDGVLDVRVLSAEGRTPRLAALWAILTSPSGGSRWLTQSLRTGVTVAVPGRCSLAHDGEVREVAGTVEFRSRPACMRVLVPAEG